MSWTLFQFVSRGSASMNQFGAATKLVSGVTVRRVLRPSLGHVFTFPPMSRPGVREAAFIIPDLPAR